jgi:excisionase family DNA binding protein
MDDYLSALDHMFRFTAMSEARGSIDEVSCHLRIAKDTIYRWIKTRSLPAHPVGRRSKFKFSGGSCLTRAWRSARRPRANASKQGRT